MRWICGRICKKKGFITVDMMKRKVFLPIMAVVLFEERNLKQTKTTSQTNNGLLFFCCYDRIKATNKNL